MSLVASDVRLFRDLFVIDCGHALFHDDRSRVYTLRCFFASSCLAVGMVFLWPGNERTVIEHVPDACFLVRCDLVAHGVGIVHDIGTFKHGAIAGLTHEDFFKV